MGDFEIRDLEIDSVVLAERIAERVADRRALAAELNLDSEKLTTFEAGSGLDEALLCLRLSCSAIHLQPRPLDMPTSLWRWPSYWLKQQVHALVVYYINRLGDRQMVFNSGALSVLEYLLIEQATEVVRLRQQVTELNERLRDLEQRCT